MTQNCQIYPTSFLSQCKCKGALKLLCTSFTDAERLVYMSNMDVTSKQMWPTALQPHGINLTWPRDRENTV